MKTFLRFVATRRLNYIDSVGVFTTVCLMQQGGWLVLVGLAVALLFCVVSVFAERVAGLYRK